MIDLQQLSVSAKAVLAGIVARLPFLQAGTGMVERTLVSKAADAICAFDAMTAAEIADVKARTKLLDVTAALHKVFDVARVSGAKIVFPAGVYRVTSGYTMSLAAGQITMEGAGHVSETDHFRSSVILLDSTAPASFFLSFAHRGTLACTGMVFQAAQDVTDRKYFRLSGGLVVHHFHRCSFELVNLPVVYEAGLYFQNSSFRDVQFRNSGMIHSEADPEGTTLVGTFLVLDNVNHEGSPLVQTNKVICNLIGVRRIAARNFLIEGQLPSAGWTALKIGNPYESQYARAHFATFDSYHCEFAGANPIAVVVNQIGGTATFREMAGLSPTAVYQLSNGGRALIKDTAFVGSEFDPVDAFVLEDGFCSVEFHDISSRSVDRSRPGFTHLRTQYTAAGMVYHPNTVSNDAAQEIYRWEGGFVPADGVTLTQSGGGTSTPSSDATYGRRLELIPNAGALNTTITATVPGLLVGEQIIIACRAKLPTFASGEWHFNTLVNGINTNIRSRIAATSSGAVVDVLIPIKLEATPTSIAVNFSNGTTSGATGNLDVYSLVFYHGESIPRKQIRKYPTNIVTRNSAAPTAGTWVQGDQVLKTAPAAATSPGWFCTAAGTPGTWAAMAALA